jgi:ABC-type branched-subunit amino acid transport system ATPase component
MSRLRSAELRAPTAGRIELLAAGLTKRVGVRSSPVLAGFGVEVPAGSVTAVVGGRGTGRTTLVRCLAGTYLPDAGSVVLRGQTWSVDLVTGCRRTAAWARSRVLGALDGELAAPPRSTGASVVRRALALADRRVGPTAGGAGDDHGGISRGDLAHTLLDDLGVVELADVAVGRMAQPERMAVALAATLAIRPSVLLLDDPLDVVPGQGCPALLERLAGLAGGGAAVLLTCTANQVATLDPIVDHIVHLTSGSAS